MPELYYSVSYTTRDPRPRREVDGTDFLFVTEAQFLAMRDRDEFAEWARCTATSTARRPRPSRARCAAASTCCSTSTPTAPRQLRQRYPEAVSVFIMAPSMAELEARLRERKSDSAGEIARRLSRAREEIAAWRQYDYLIINRDVKEAVDQLATIIQAERCRTSRLTLRFPDMEVPD